MPSAVFRALAFRRAPLRVPRRRAARTAVLLAGVALMALPASHAAAQDNRALIADMQVRITQLEDMVRDLTGKLEEADYQRRQLEQRMERMEREIDVRVGALEGSGAGGAGLGGASSGAPSAAPSAAPGQPLAPDSGVLGYITPPAGSSGSGSGASSLDSAAARAVLPSGPPEAQYNHAFSLLRQGDYARAEQAFQAFIEVNGSHSLAGNAQYWLGETHYARGNYEAAAVAFAKGYKEYPNSSKTPDNLFKLGMSMSALGKKRESCAAFQKLRADYPSLGGTLQRQVDDQMARNGC
ncbi:tol-pal system protein YbgF [Roseospira marina]|uniref:Cell division coordinator CpoB n=1 Tax=Roseospira marina TaxID=140057 RepID=A0A5M6IGD8_9PROT|nr:tol-pal system protein YbgF [Roseospira marina]KAA5606648.1 tol-pal system protein YbgF [Roseospira marina]MBB4313947.1 tol-pal system protein YbgF [Roseospira marina]MBB5087109.1 tol-pal system protein YbgF [Roseospira marina]